VKDLASEGLVPEAALQDGPGPALAVVPNLEASAARIRISAVPHHSGQLSFRFIFQDRFGTPRLRVRFKRASAHCFS
jgi:hypothetical protein